MEITLLLIQKISSLFLIMAIGFALVRAKLLKSTDTKPISVLTVYAIALCAILSAYQVELTQDVIIGFFSAMGVSVLLMIGQVLITKLIAIPLHLTSLERACSIYSNCGNLIIPLVGFCLGDEWVIYSLAYMSVMTAMIWTHGKSLIKEQREWDFRSIITNLNLIAIVLGFVMFVLNIRLVGPLAVLATDLGSFLGPACMLTAGMIVGGMSLKGVFANKRVWLVTFIRLIFIPALATLALKFCPLATLIPNGQSIFLVTLLAIITPSASNTVQLAVLYDKDADHASAINVVSTLMCIVTMPLWVAVYYL